MVDCFFNIAESDEILQLKGEHRQIESRNEKCI